ncbi:MAG: hypothetical protein EA376_00150 [Phycisphaeraceae bacterium]|nr:MAG: hypothetical protein EA376_00150 [Phycisphaeraceae bacterium]
MLTGVLCAGGCVSARDGVEPVDQPVAAGEGVIAVSPFTPVRIRVHPLTHWSRDERGRPTIEAHLELFDRWGHTVKGAGLVRFELASPGAAGIGATPPPGAGERPDLRWEVDMRDPAVASQGHYDHVTRTFLVTLLVADESDWGRRKRLRVSFTTLDQRTLSDELTLEP